jgi:aspartyl/asparaginyl-tRNA synthetase
MDFEMEIKWHYHEVLDVVEGLFVEIFKGLKEKYAKDIKTVAQQYSVQDFKFPEDGHVLRLKFVDGAKMLREAGYEQSDDEDLK